MACQIHSPHTRQHWVGQVVDEVKMPWVARQDSAETSMPMGPRGGRVASADTLKTNSAKSQERRNGIGWAPHLIEDDNGAGA